MDDSEDGEQVPNKPICIGNKASVYNTHCKENAHSVTLIYLKILSVNQDYIAGNDRMTVNNELDRMLKEASMT
jgi:hypothetical protein